jgi:hypothetical protein
MQLLSCRFALIRADTATTKVLTNTQICEPSSRFAIARMISWQKTIHAEMKTAHPPVEPAQIAAILLCAAAFAGGVAHHSGLSHGIVAGLFIFGVCSLGLFLPRVINTLSSRLRKPHPDDRNKP